MTVMRVASFGTVIDTAIAERDHHHHQGQERTISHASSTLPGPMRIPNSDREQR